MNYPLIDLYPVHKIFMIHLTKKHRTGQSLSTGIDEKSKLEAIRLGSH
jgi:hypothetical protein